MTDPPVAPDDTPTRLQCPFCKLTGSANGLSDLQSVCAYCGRDSKDAMWEIDALRTEISRLREALEKSEANGTNWMIGADLDHERAEKLGAEVSRLQQENALLRRSLEMLTKQMAE